MELLRRPLLSQSNYQYSVLKSNEEQPLISSGPSYIMVDDNFDEINKKLAKGICSRCLSSCLRFFGKKEELTSRQVFVGRKYSKHAFPENKICNQKFNLFTFLPGVLINQFKDFLNLYFLLLACTQFLPQLKVGYWYTYWGPLGAVVFYSVCQEAWSEYNCYKRDKEINSELYKKLLLNGKTSPVHASEIQVSDVIIVEKNQRVPADLILLRTKEKNGTCFIRTDQMDGETDWKLRVAVGFTHKLQTDSDVLKINGLVEADKPNKDIYNFLGSFQSSNGNRNDENFKEEGLSIENTAWANTVIASDSVVGVVVFTGVHTKSSMNTSTPSIKSGLLEKEINTLTVILFISVIIFSLILVSVKGFKGPWYRYLFRFVILFSYIIPISLRVNLEMGKLFYRKVIQRDAKIPDTQVRTCNLCEELGRIDYLMSDKTGTLTQNEMIFKRLHMGTVSYSGDSMDEVADLLKQGFSLLKLHKNANVCTTSTGDFKSKKIVKNLSAVKALAICHNVTPTYDEETKHNDDDWDDFNQIKKEANHETSFTHIQRSYQASSPDEVALVKWTESVGLTLVARDLDVMKLQTPHGDFIDYKILQVFPFKSETKRMGIIVQDLQSNQIVFYVKGADAVMTSIVQYNDWLDEECDNMARDGLRTLVVAQKHLTQDAYNDFEKKLHKAKVDMVDRQHKVTAVIESLERDMELLCLTGVEDKLQENVKPTLEMLAYAGIKIWMLTGDKLETAICIAKSARLVGRDQEMHVFKQVTNRDECHWELNAFRRKRGAQHDTALIIRGSSLRLCIDYYSNEFIELACQAPAVIICRCSPTQKAEIVEKLRKFDGDGKSKRICAVGDGGNDVSMIQAAHCGIGIVGKEGKQASLASDFSISKFSHIAELLLVHGRHSYKRSAALSQFIIHRGLIISVMQAIFSSVFYFSSVSLFQGFLMVGYTTVYTMFPVFSLVLDKDVKSEVAIQFPELYADLRKGRSLSFKTFLQWVLISIYQGGAIMYGALFLFDHDFTHIVSISFIALVFTSLLMVGLTIKTWHFYMILSEAASLILFAFSLFFLQYFGIDDMEFLRSTEFLWKLAVIVILTCLPLTIFKWTSKYFSPPIYAKLDD